MQVVGDVMDVRPSSFASKRPGESGKVIDMVYLDLYDDTAKLVPCEMRKDASNGLVLEKRMRIIADVTSIKKLTWGVSGFSLIIHNVREAAPLGVEKMASPIPAGSAAAPRGAARP